jgi:thymidylate synthase
LGVLKKNIMFEKGDKFIHYTKYGGVNIGDVKDIQIEKCFDTNNKVIFDKQLIITTNNVILDTDGSDGRIYKINNFMTDEGVERLTNLVKNLKENKEKRRKELEKKYNTKFKTIL